MTDAEREQIARDWRVSGISQPDYARKFGIRDRTLRAWIARFAPEPVGTEAAIRVVREAIDRLQAVLRSLEEPEIIESVDVTLDDLDEELDHPVVMAPLTRVVNKPTLWQRIWWGI